MYKRQALVVYFGGLSVLDGQVTPGDWFLFVESISLFWFPLTGIASFWSQFQPVSYTHLTPPPSDLV